MKTVAMLALGALTCGLACSSFAAENAVKSSWPPETLSGKITMVEPGQRIVVIEGADNVPFDLVVTPSTRIEAGKQAVTLNGLSQYENKSVSVRFVPESRGDIAKTIQING